MYLLCAGLQSRQENSVLRSAFRDKIKMAAPLQVTRVCANSSLSDRLGDRDI